MDKRIILATAGSGKTTYLVKQIPKDKRSLIITYTISNVLNLRNNIITEFDCFPENIILQTYFTFLYSFCIQPFLMDVYKLNGLFFKTNPYMFAKGDSRYLTKNGNLYSNRAAKFIEEKGLYQGIKKRLEKYYQYLFIDEIQDFAGHDFTFLEHISSFNINTLYVGDFYQHTFDTGRDGNVKQSLHDNYDEYKARFKKLKFLVDEKTLIKSYRCSPQICNYITEKLNINIESHKSNETEIKYINDKLEIETIMKDDKIIKLFYQVHYLYKCKSRNWGECKGENIYSDVCVILNKTTLTYFKKNKLNELSSKTLNKLYVAISRAHGNVYFVSEIDIKEYRKDKI
jgi:DNA helicase-2/ATP-dependent DNA helicase PcrA